ncbi:MAG: ATPase F0F1 [Chloroflexaceae bacterium]|nr:ATPase F0F1 [Chloroflexaceae bacterium]
MTQEPGKFREHIGRKAIRRHRARQRTDESIWFGLGMFGLVGWSVAIPTLIGLALGIWVDATWPSRFSWTLMLLLAGVGAGCLNAWLWVKRERQAIEHQVAEERAAEEQAIAGRVAEMEPETKTEAKKEMGRANE